MSEWKRLEEDLCVISDAIFMGNLMAHEIHNATDIQLRSSSAYFAITSALFSLYHEVIQYAAACEREMPKQSSGYYSWLIVYAAIIRDLRGAFVLYANGYLAQAIPMLRGVFERLECMGSAVNELASFGKMFGYEYDETTFNGKLDDVFKKGEKVRNAARKKLWEGLSDEANTQLKNTKIIQHQQVHLGALTQAEVHMDMKEGEFRLLPPTPRQPIRIAFYCLSMQSFAVFGRLLCFLQQRDRPFSDTLTSKWKLCDEAMVYQVRNMKSEENQDIGKYFMEFVDKRFTFSPETHFYNENILYAV
jgi:hypothetical protein